MIGLPAQECRGRAIFNLHVLDTVCDTVPSSGVLSAVFFQQCSSSSFPGPVRAHRNSRTPAPQTSRTARGAETAELGDDSARRANCSGLLQLGSLPRPPRPTSGRVFNASCKYFQSAMSSANRNGGSPCCRHSRRAMVWLVILRIQREYTCHRSRAQTFLA